MQNTDFMPEFLTTDGHTQVIVPLRIKPYNHKEMPTITGNAFSHEAGTVLYGNYTMEYLLQDGDRLRLIANHHKKTVQLMLFTHNSDLLKLLPGDRPSSLVADIISKIHRYRIRSESYKQPLSPEQLTKLQLANECINSLSSLLREERHIKPHDFAGQEQLRRKVLAIVKTCTDGNRRITNNPVVSEGSLGYLLYDAKIAAQRYQFNRVFSVSRQDQMDFSKIHKTLDSRQKPLCFIWDSELHIGHDNRDLDDALRVICTHYNLIPASHLNEVPANRFSKFETFLRSLWNDGQDWLNYLSIEEKPTHKTKIKQRPDGVTITKIKPYYALKGLPQQGYSTLNELVFNLTNSSVEPIHAKSLRKAKNYLGKLPNGNWVIVAQKNQIILRLDNKLVALNYFIKDAQFYPLPEGQDLYTLSQVSKRHLYLPERLSLRIQGFISRIPSFFQNFYKRMSHFIIHDLHEDFMGHVHATHTQKKETAPQETKPRSSALKRGSLHDALENKGLLANGQTLEEFIKEQISNSPYVIARANHPPSPHPYDNPLHRILGVLRHLGSFFIDTSERNPMVGTLAMAAYLYGAGAVLAPKALESVLTKLYLSGLISGIEPTQKLARLMNHGTISEAISASVTLWQGMITVGNLDKFFVEAVSILKEDPGEIAIIAALALSLGYGLTKAIPSLQQEMGDFPYTNYAALGGKGGAALYDTIMHPGDDWLLGTCKWICKHIITLAKIGLAPFVEWYFYGFNNGFINGLKKSGAQILRSGKQCTAAITDFFLAILTVPLIEGSALLIHVPFRGITNIIRKLCATLGNLGAIGRLLIDIAERPSLNNFIAEFQFSTLYGFSSPIKHCSDTLIINIGINALRILFIPPLQLIKNIIILPLLDAFSLGLRISLTIINPISRILAYSTGTVLSVIGSYWDNSIGMVFSISATVVTELCDWLDNTAGEAKQYILSQIEISRSNLFSWAFHEEDTLLHTILDDQHYYCSEPRRSELVPHSNSHCLIRNLLDEGQQNTPAEIPDSQPAYSKLFPLPEHKNQLDHQEQPMLNSYKG
ncbi:hypothetical protein I5282_03660 [Legionella sp. 30cs62]|uniref:Coiled-coil protein n=2 Tax=Legionella bononiensis TaxID=2793102 RepID=A0ABS1W8J5_9GAMM|nr:hypothetical protein [Legionella bononiensis]